MSASGPSAPILVTLLTGFLGAGKTTLLNRLLADPAVVDTAVIVNEFGEAGIDHLLVETAGDGVIELSDGCLCCTVRGDLVDTLADLVDRIQSGRIAPLARVVIETTGLADPVPVLASLMAHPALVQAYALDGVVTVVDALSGARNLADYAEARRQAAVADRIVVTKTDIAPRDALDTLLGCLRPINPAAPVLLAAGGEATPAGLLNCGPFDRASKAADVAAWLQGEEACRHAHSAIAHPHGRAGHGGHAARHGTVGSFSILHGPPIPRDRIFGFLDLLAQKHGDRLLRMKAIVHVLEDPARPMVLHGVRGFLHPPARLPAWPAAMRPASRLVLIGEALNEDHVRDLFAAFAGEPRLDAADRAAFLANPLAVPGVSF